ncbi:hypothetical protein DEA8626_02546 [Defluviimonas aquaemixtae]|uniref:DUF883 domain-containing protein n=1 Tax=Albidovulum aquaemixtae TaxID=1542388 RepID=A0A2R8BJE4_9RHOB|nr:hypothetical protein [Defluviimonas aquaemixtae]SPH23483.1 hypothetical protein DEA8626_02546 [Defluviimonas aquaemixtae]
MTRENIKKAVSDVAETAKTTGAKALNTARKEVEEAAGQAGSALKDAAEARAEAGKDAISDHGHALADRLRDQAGDPDQSFRGRLLTVVADGVSEISDDLRGRNLQSILERTEQFARQHPGAFVAGAALAGFSIARFAMASTSDHSSVAQAADLPETGNATVPVGRSEYAPARTVAPTPPAGRTSSAPSKEPQS